MAKDPGLDQILIETVESAMKSFSMIAGETFHHCSYCISSEVYNWDDDIIHKADCVGPRLIQYIRDRQ